MNTKQVAFLHRSGWGTKYWNLSQNRWNLQLFIEKTDYSKIKNVINNIQDKLPTIKSGSNILIDKNSEVPRTKFKEFLNDNNYKKVTLLSKADVVFVKRETIKYLSSLELEDILFVPDDEFSKLGINKYDNDYVVALQNQANQDTEYTTLEKKCITEEGVLISSYRNAKLHESINFIVSLINSKATLVYDDVLTKTINKDGIELDEEVFETLKGMLLSKDEDTFKLGIEMLSNVNLEEENIFKISLLLNYVYTQTRRFYAMSRYTNKNFKSLLNFLSLNKIRWNQNWETYGMSMWNRFGHTEHKDFIKKYIVDNLNVKFSRQTNGESAQIVDIIFQ